MKRKMLWLLLLLAINGLLLGSILGMPWLPATFQEMREPERLAAQQHREAIVLLPASDAPASDVPAAGASAAETVAEASSAPADSTGNCLELGGWSKAQWQAASDELGALRVQFADGQWGQVERHDSERLWVRLPPFAERAAAERAVAALHDKSVEDVSIVSDAQAGTHTVSLGVFRDPVRAQRRLTELRAKQVEAEITPDPRSPARIWVQVHNANDDVTARLAALAKRHKLAAPAPCRADG
ncbi:hypothetical protein MW7_014405 [Imbroritus primus]|uniref:Uncharacterized protein n=1 Tax=Imbroritus primus TaxID=3058603 RepID=A0ACD3SLW8_9BURK|nr:hypothetical protein MW7_014405 [Burkholderiaceae bacterium PBA]